MDLVHRNFSTRYPRDYATAGHGVSQRLPESGIADFDNYCRKFILQKTGELLSIRAQLNLYSELTDSLPDLFWDTKHELGLEGYYDQVGRALDTNIRVKVGLSGALFIWHFSESYSH